MSTRRALIESTVALALLACGERSGSSVNTGGMAAIAGAAPTAGVSPISAAGAGGAAGDANVGAGNACAEAATPNPWASWPMPDPATQGQAPSQHYTLNDPDVAIDDVTQLSWQRRVSDAMFTWDDARSYCDCLTLGGYDDWQLPSRIELVSIVDFTRQDPSLDPLAFPGTPFEWFWSSSAVAGRDDLVWYVAFFDGNTHTTNKDSDFRVRCVRRVAGKERSVVPATDGTVADARTGLTWQQGASAALLSWADANQYCSSLDLAGGGFRLPSMKELQSLIDESTTEPAIDSVLFPSTPSVGFWAATPLADTPGAAWFVNFADGVSYNSLTERTYRARCVR